MQISVSSMYFDTYCGIYCLFGICKCVTGSRSSLVSVNGIRIKYFHDPDSWISG